MERGLNNRDLGTSARRVGRGAGIVAILLLSTTSLVAQSTQTTAGVDVTSQYFDRGIITENSGLILQPWISIDTPITPPAEGVGLDFHIGLYNSFHTGDTGTAGTTVDFAPEVTCAEPSLRTDRPFDRVELPTSVLLERNLTGSAVVAAAAPRAPAVVPASRRPPACGG